MTSCGKLVVTEGSTGGGNGGGSGSGGIAGYVKENPGKVAVGALAIGGGAAYLSAGDKPTTPPKVLQRGGGR